MGQKKREEQWAMWVAVSDLPKSESHPFYEKLNGLLAKHGFDEFVEAQCRPFYAEKMGPPQCQDRCRIGQQQEAGRELGTKQWDSNRGKSLGEPRF